MEYCTDIAIYMIDFQLISLSYSRPVGAFYSKETWSFSDRSEERTNFFRAVFCLLGAKEN